MPYEIDRKGWNNVICDSLTSFQNDKEILKAKVFSKIDADWVKQLSKEK